MCYYCQSQIQFNNTPKISILLAWLSGGAMVSLLAPKSAKFREIPREIKVIAGQGHPRSSILVSVEGAYATSNRQQLVLGFCCKAPY